MSSSRSTTIASLTSANLARHRRRFRHRGGASLALSLAPSSKKSLRTRRGHQKRRRQSKAGHGMLSMVGPVLDARRAVHLPPPGAHGAYTVVRTRSVTTIATNTAGQRTVLIAGQFHDSSASPQVNCLPYHAVYGVGTAVPGTTESYIVDPLLSGASAGAYNLSLHAMTVVITADGSATTSIGTFYMGAIPSRINRLTFATLGASA